MRFLSLVLLAGFGCTEAKAPQAPMIAASAASPSASAEVSADAWVLLLHTGDAGAPAASEQRSSGGKVVLARVGGDFGPSWTVLTTLSAAALAKGPAVQRLLDRIEASPGPERAFSCYLQLDEANLPGEAALRAELSGAGFVPQTVAKNIVTGTVPAKALGTVLALPRVKRLDLPEGVRPR